MTPRRTFVLEERGFCMPKEMRQCWKSVVGAPPGNVTVSSSHRHPRYLFFLTRWAMACYRPMLFRLLVLYWGSGCGGDRRTGAAVGPGERAMRRGLPLPLCRASIGRPWVLLGQRARPCPHACSVGYASAGVVPRRRRTGDGCGRS